MKLLVLNEMRLQGKKMYYFTITTSNISDFKLELKLNFNSFGNAHWHTVQALLKITTGVCFRNWHVIHPWDTQ